MLRVSCDKIAKMCNSYSPYHVLLLDRASRLLTLIEFKGAIRL